MKQVLLLVLFFAGCQSQGPEPKEVVARVGSYVISKAEFDESFKASSFASQDTRAAREAFLNNMINKKLILLDAQAKGLDKDADFLKMVEHFWQQSLVTVALQAKTQEGGNLDQWVEYLKKQTKVQINQEYLQ